MANNIHHDVFFIVKFSRLDITFVSYAYFATEKDAAKFAEKFITTCPGYQYRILPIYYMSAESI